jgi:hypothetical protein
LKANILRHALRNWAATAQLISPWSRLLMDYSKSHTDFLALKNDWVRIRYARTNMIEGYIPALLIAFIIDENNNVVLQWAEPVDEAEISD